MLFFFFLPPILFSFFIFACIYFEFLSMGYYIVPIKDFISTVMEKKGKKFSSCLVGQLSANRIGYHFKKVLKDKKKKQSVFNVGVSVILIF